MVAITRPLNFSEKRLLQPFFLPNTLDLARVVEGKVPFWLHPKMSAVVLGVTIYIRAPLDQPRVYQPNTLSGLELLAHELTHVEQFLSGMTIRRYLWASRHGYRNNPYEIEAYAKAARICNALQPQFIAVQSVQN